MSRTVYHVTLSENVTQILEQGLIPQIGSVASACAEVENRTFFFGSTLAIEDALSGWIGEALAYAERLCVLSIEAEGIELKHDADYELYSTTPIPPESISVIVDASLPGFTAPGFEHLAYIAMTDDDLSERQA